MVLCAKGNAQYPSFACLSHKRLEVADEERGVDARSNVEWRNKGTPFAGLNVVH